MKLYLVDTDVISAGARARAGQADLLTWMDEHSKALFLSVVSIAEIEAGIAKLHREGASRKAAGLATWLSTLLHLYAPRILPFDLEVARRAGRLSDLARGRGHNPGLADVAIAATAMVHGLTVLTRNVGHFEPLGVPFIDPFERLPVDDRPRGDG